MTLRGRSSRKKVLIWGIIIGTGLPAAYLCFVAAVSLWIGFSHAEQSGFWVPILAGLLCLFVVLVLYVRLTRKLLRRLEDEDVVRL
ncbi:MAG: hypothetical protein JRF59_06215 [Deltaproteobacteria bacterium]|nr:hypothetical protein [Deltaproteobacteria bacterium]MBW1948419.1 hypothetical protein [Deltaproteobacteria bacterium]MBW2008688.1 hypothetical protein [Deltaproteobacteria bacterium]MBW2347419.1 hypothetical protein [Deltaproteobacteria bacterium]